MPPGPVSLGLTHNRTPRYVFSECSRSLSTTTSTGVPGVEGADVLSREVRFQNNVWTKIGVEEVEIPQWGGKI